MKRHNDRVKALSAKVNKNQKSFSNALRILVQRGMPYNVAKSRLEQYVTVN